MFHTFSYAFFYSIEGIKKMSPLSDNPLIEKCKKAKQLCSVCICKLQWYVYVMGYNSQS